MDARHEIEIELSDTYASKYLLRINKLRTEINYVFEDGADAIGSYYENLKTLEIKIDILKNKLSNSKRISHVIREDLLSMLQLLSARNNILIAGSKAANRVV